MFQSKKTTAEFLEEVNSYIENALPDSLKISFINEIEQKLYEGVFRFLKKIEIESAVPITPPTISETGEALQINDIQKIIADGREHGPGNVDYPVENTFFPTSDGKIGLEPEPTGTAEIAIIYRERPKLKTATNTGETYIQVPDGWLDIIRKYVVSEIYLQKQEYASSGNQLNGYNQAASDIQVLYDRYQKSVNGL